MKRKHNFIWRAAVLLLALTCASTSIYFTNAKYITKGSFSNTFTVYSLIAFTGAGTHNNAPDGKWAFYAKGGTGDNSGSGLNLTGPAGVVQGVYTKTNGNGFVIETINNGGAGQGTGKKGGSATAIFQGASNSGNGNPPLPDEWTIPASWYDDIVAVAGGSGGDAGSRDGGFGGSADGGAARVIDGGDGYAGTNSGGKGGYENGTDGNCNGARGGWFYGGACSTGLGANVGGGGCGILGGEGGTAPSTLLGTASGGGGGASYITTSTAVAGYTPAAGYETYAWNWFTTLKASNDAVLVWLGP